MERTFSKTTIIGIVVMIMGVVAGVFFNDWIQATALITTGAGFVAAKDAK